SAPATWPRPATSRGSCRRAAACTRPAALATISTCSTSSGGTGRWRSPAASHALAARPAGTVPCHNDLLAANFIDDGDRIWLVDYELSGNNDACFELG